MTTKCTFPGCTARTEQDMSIRPAKGWAHLCAWGPGIPDGFYCIAHADVIEELELSGELRALQSGAAQVH